ncbi:MAG TPA: hypothetical protein VEO91_03925 [Candidatus Limnocylindria bacterium]|nr:hypothetical protein [Candidatus Limnocylindria bacterium]
MHRRPLGRGRRLAAASAVILLVGSLLPWWTVGGTDGLPPISGNAFEASGIVVFLAALATLALVTLPFASERPVALDRWPAYLIVLGLAVIGYVLRVAGLILEGPLASLRPDRAPGLYIVAIGLAGLARAAFEINQEPEPR